MELGYARVSTRAQDIDRQYAALAEAGIGAERVWADRATGASSARAGLQALLAYARPGDVLVAHTLDRLGRNLRETLTLVHELREQGIGVRTLADPVPVDTADESAMGQLAVSLLGLFAEMERVFQRERAAHARAVGEAQGKPAGRPQALDGEALQAARAAYLAGMSAEDVARAHGVSPSTIYRHVVRTVQPGERATSTAAVIPEPPGRDTGESRPAPVAEEAAAPAPDRQPKPEHAPAAAATAVKTGSRAPDDGEVRAIGPRERIDLDSVTQTRTDEGRTRVLATTRRGKPVLVGFLERAATGRKWQGYSAHMSRIDRPQRTKREALLRLIEPHQ